MKLIIAEKNSVGKVIAKAIGATSVKGGYIEGNDVIVSWCAGHLAGFAPPNAYGENLTLPIIPSQWKLEIKENTKQQFEILKKLMNDSRVTEIISATDADRQGELIFRYVYELVKCRKPCKRLWVSSLEESAILQALRTAKPMSDYDNLYFAGLAFSKSDWLIGMNGSRLFTKRFQSFKPVISIGRVQTPTLALIVERSEKVKNFVKTPFYNVVLDLGDFSVKSANFENKNEAEKLAEICHGKQVKINTVEKKKKTKKPPKLYDLTTLQREANRKFGYTADETLEKGIQQLYEKGLASYPRTDSQFLTEDMGETVTNLLDGIGGKFGVFNPNSNPKLIMNNKKVSSHYAIIPTVKIADYDLNSLTDTEKNILFLLIEKLICSVSKSYEYDSLKITAECEKNLFFATGKIENYDNSNSWRDMQLKFLQKIGRKPEPAENEDEDEQKTFNFEIKENTIYSVKSAKTEERFTSPPKHFTEDTLLSAMERAGVEFLENADEIEKKGIGTPATRAKIIETLIKREYIKREKKNLIPTERGILLIKYLPKDIQSPKMTADWENMLLEVEKGNISSSELLTEIENFVKMLCVNYSETVDTPLKTYKAPENFAICPFCGKNIVEYPKSFSCENKECGLIFWKESYGYKFTKVDIKALISKKVTSEKELKSKANKPYKAVFVLTNEKKIEMNFVNKNKK